MNDEARSGPSRRRGSLRPRVFFVLWSLVAAAGVIGLLPGAAGADALCPSPATTSPDGSILFVSPCAGEITVTSPEVETIVGSSGDDVINAGPDVETIYAGEGDDVVYAGPETTLVAGGGGEDELFGEPLENEIGPEGSEESEVPYVPEVEYEPASPAEAARALRSVLPQQGPQATASRLCGAENPCFGGTGDQTLEGGEGNDTIYGQRGNDTLLGQGGLDGLYGGVGDDLLFGGTNNDFLAGGPGKDELFGDAGNDLVRGDATIDEINGQEGTDTLSFSTGVTPGFQFAYPSGDGVKAVAGFPEENSGEGRGVYVRLEGANNNCSANAYAACDGGAALGGGDDVIATTQIENVIGTPFADVIVGSSGANKIYGGGGGDVIEGKGGADEIFGGAEGDYLEDSSSGTVYGGKGTNNCVGFSSKNECSGTEARVRQHEPTSTMSAGLMMLKNPAATYDTVYMTGTEGEDKVNAHYVSASHEVTFTSAGSTKFGGASEGCTYEEGGKVASEGKTAKCPLPAASPTLDAVVMAGLKGPDKLTVSGEPKFLATATPILLGGEGNDYLVGSNTTEDALVDGNGTGADTLEAFSFDDLLTNNEGVDILEGGPGNDLLLSTTVCDGDTLQGGEKGKDDGEAKNDASWTKLPGPQGVTADIATQSAGSSFNEAAQAPACSPGTPSSLFGIDDLEGSNQKDALLGGETANLLIGHLDEDNLEGAGGDDKINSFDGSKDKVGGGPQTNLDECIVDLYVDEVNGCEKLEPAPETVTTISQPVAHNGAPGSVDVKGNVTAKQTVQRFHVFLEYEKMEGGVFKLKSKPEAKLDANGNYVNSEGVGKGKWQVRAVFPAQANYEASASSYQPFTIE